MILSPPVSLLLPKDNKIKWFFINHSWISPLHKGNRVYFNKIRNIFLSKVLEGYCYTHVTKEKNLYLNHLVTSQISLGIVI